jgi:hypothetical protein
MRAGDKAGLLPEVTVDLLVANCGARPVLGPRVVETAGPE